MCERGVSFQCCVMVGRLISLNNDAFDFLYSTSIISIIVVFVFDMMQNLSVRYIKDNLSKVKRQWSQILKGLSHEISRPVFWPVWMHLGLNVNRFCF